MNSVNTNEDNLINIYSNIVESFDGNIGNCVLLLGPELAINKTISESGITHKQFFKELSEKHSDTIEKYFEEENLFAFKDGISFRHVTREIKNFYKNVGDAILLEKITRIKFPLIINFSPDLALNKVYKKNEIDFIEDHFSKSTVTDNSLEKPTKERPIIYNLFGSIEADGSLILNHGHMHAALEKLLAERSLPDNIEAYLKNANTYIFLGFNYESWYYQLLCHRLNVKTPERYSILSTPDCRHNDYTNRIMGKHFRMDFTGESPDMTLDRIVKTCEESSLDNSSVLRETIMGGTYSLVFSYAWKNDDEDESNQVHRENIVDWLEKEISANPNCFYNIYRDKKDLRFGDNLKEFMIALTQCETIIQVVSDKYVKSRNCMYEALHIHKNQGVNKVYKVVVKENEDDNFDSSSVEEYTNYWKSLYEKEIEHIEQSISDSIAQDKAKDKFRPLREIIDFIPTFFQEIFENIHFLVSMSDFEVSEDGSVVLKEDKERDYKEKMINLLENHS